MIIKMIYLFSMIIFLMLPSMARAQLDGTDTVPGDSCAGFAAGATRMTASPTQDGSHITLICDGTIWNSASDSLWSKDGNLLYTVSDNVAIGLGTNTGQIPFLMRKQFTTPNAYHALIDASIFYEPATDSTSGEYYGTAIKAEVPSTVSANINLLRGNYFGSVHEGSGNINRLDGTYVYTQHTGPGTATDITGLLSHSYAQGNTTNYTGIKSQVDTWGGANIQTMTGVYVHVDNIANNSNITNRHGIFLKTPVGTATNDYGIYQQGTQNNYFRGNLGIGKVPVAALDVVGDIHYTGIISDVSDRRKKEDIRIIDRPLERIGKLHGVSFAMKGADGERELGLIAQDVSPVFPELVVTMPDGTLALNYQGMTGPLVEAVKELHEQNNALAADNAELRRMLHSLSARLDVIEGKTRPPLKPYNR